MGRICVVWRGSAMNLYPVIVKVYLYGRPLQYYTEYKIIIQAVVL